MNGDWRPGAGLEILRDRAAVVDGIRAFFRERGVLEVDTPQLCRTTTSDPHLKSFDIVAAVPGQGRVSCFLQTSPEFAMKRLLAAGSGPIFQISHAFRDGELSRRHNPEFSMLEWYRPDMGIDELRDEVAELVARILSLSAAFPRISYRDLFQTHLGVDPLLCSLDALIAVLERQGLAYVTRPEAKSDWRLFCLDLLFSHCIEPHLGDDSPVFVVEFPVEQAALAAVRSLPDGARVAERFELFYRGVELANGYRELTDAEEFRRRHQVDDAARKRQGLPTVPFDERLHDAMRSGLPACSGVALGVDRLMMLRSGSTRIDEVMAFSINRV